MRLIARTHWVVLVDLLLPAAVLIFLLPVNPSISSIPAVLWVLVQLMFAPRDRRWAAWPMVFVLLLFSRSWWLNEMPHPVSAEDGLLFVAALLAGACVLPTRWALLLRLQLLVLPFLVLRVGPKPWTPNPLAGANQGGYVLGLLLLVAVACCWQSKQPAWQRLLAGLATALAGFLVWQTGSRAAFIAAALAASLLWLKNSSAAGLIWKRLLLLASCGAVALGIKQWLRPSIMGIPGMDLSSDSGRLEIAQCYSGIPFSGNNRFLYGIGFERAKEFCRDPIQGGVADHAHNLYLQLFANTGILGLVGLVLAVVLLVLSWRDAGERLNPLTSCAGQLMLAYTLIQGFFDLSLLHWPVTLVVTGLVLGIPLSTSRAAWSPSSVSNRGD